MTDEKGAWVESLCFGSSADWGWELLLPLQTLRQAARPVPIPISLIGKVSRRAWLGLFFSCDGKARGLQWERGPVL